MDRVAFFLCIAIPGLWPVAIIIALMWLVKNRKQGSDEVDDYTEAVKTFENLKNVSFDDQTMDVIRIKKCPVCQAREVLTVIYKLTDTGICLNCGDWCIVS